MRVGERGQPLGEAVAFPRRERIDSPISIEVADGYGQIRHRVAHRAGSHRHLQDVAVAEVARADEERFALDTGVIPIAVRVQRRHAPVPGETRRRQTSLILGAVTLRAERAALDLDVPEPVSYT